MIKKMNLVRPAFFAALLCGVSATSLLAQGPAAAPSPGAPGPLTTPPPLVPPTSPPPPPPQMQHAGPRSNPLFDALDTNHDGVISAEEIANASASLKALLKNGSDHLTREDLRPLPPAGAPGRPGADEAGQPRPRVGAIRPHNPPPRGEEDMAAEPAGRRMHPPGPEREQAEENFDRPHRWHEDTEERQRPSRRENEEMDDARPFPRHERMSRHEEPSRPEEDGTDGDAHPHRGPRREDSRMQDEAGPHQHGPMNEEGGPHQHGPMNEEGGPRQHGPMDEEAGPRQHGPMQDEGGPRQHGPMNEEGGPGPLHHDGPPPMPLFDALDTNHDGTISAEEIANASAALKGLLKNGSDHLTRDDLRPQGPPHGER